MGTADSLERAEEAREHLLDESFSAGHHEDDISLVVDRGPHLHHKPGGWIARAIIFGFEYLQKTAFSGISTNLVVYLHTILHGNNASNSAKVSSWIGTCLFTPLVGALISDIYWGNYKTIFVSGLTSLFGLIIITISAFTLSLNRPSCEGTSCYPASEAQNLAFFSGLYLLAFGSGGVDSALIPLGVDQFDEENPIERENKGSFFIWMYFCQTFGLLTSGTLIVWIQEYVDWSLGFGIATACMAIGFGGFILGSPIFRTRKPSGSPVKSIAQVLIASIRKMSLRVPKESSLLYEVNSKNSDTLGRGRLAHTNEFRFLDKAAIISNLDLKDGDLQISWSLCTVTQVEELKILLRLLPMWTSSVFFSVAFSQMVTTFIQQGSVMEIRIGSFSIPPASLSSFKVISAMVWALVYNKVIAQIGRRYFGIGSELTLMQRMGIGHFLIILTMATAACVEARRMESIRVGIPISITWQLPQYFIQAGSEIFFYISQYAFFYDQAPEAMKSIFTAFILLSSSLGNYLSSLVVTLIEVVTTAGGGPGWIPDDLNKGNLVYYFWSLTGMCTLNFAAYLAYAKNYTPKNVL